jgi:hypothetical protein
VESAKWQFFQSLFSSFEKSLKIEDDLLSSVQKFSLACLAKKTRHTAVFDNANTA